MNYWNGYSFSHHSRQKLHYQLCRETILRQRCGIYSFDYLLIVASFNTFEQIPKCVANNLESTKKYQSRSSSHSKPRTSGASRYSWMPQNTIENALAMCSDARRSFSIDYDSMKQSIYFERKIMLFRCSIEMQWISISSGRWNVDALRCYVTTSIDPFMERSEKWRRLKQVNEYITTFTTIILKP